MTRELWAKAEELRADRAKQWKDDRHPNCCWICGWNVSSHGISSYGLDCPPGGPASPAAQARRLPAQILGDLGPWSRVEFNGLVWVKFPETIGGRHEWVSSWGDGRSSFSMLHYMNIGPEGVKIIHEGKSIPVIQAEALEYEANDIENDITPDLQQVQIDKMVYAVNYMRATARELRQRPLDPDTLV